LEKYVFKNFIILSDYFFYHILLLWPKGSQINFPLTPKNLGMTLVDSVARADQQFQANGTCGRCCVVDTMVFPPTRRSDYE
jgi:hypothetical protein